MKNIFRTILFALLIKASSLEAQSVIFNKVLPPEGENFLHITGIVQDKLGYMWMASKKGLYRYDGYNFVSYKNNPLNPNSLASNALESICLDSSGILWIGTFGSGLERFDPMTETFTHIHHDPKNKASLASDTIAALLQDSKGILWVGTPKGLGRLDPMSGNFFHYTHQVSDPGSLSSNIVRTLYEDRQGTLWVGTGSAYIEPGELKGEGGLNRMDARTGKFTRYVHDPNDTHSLINNKVSAIFEDSKGNFWVGTAGDGLHTMNRQTGSFERYPYDATDPEKLSRPPLNEELPWDHISFIKEDAGGAIWIGASDAGINRYDPQTKKIKHFQSNTVVNFQSLGVFNDNTSWAAYASRDGTFWISTILGNLFRVDPFNRNLPFVSLGRTANSFYEEESGIFWAATSNGLYVSDSNIRHSRFPKNLYTLAGRNLFFNRISEDREHNVWFCSNDGLYKVDSKNQNIIRHANDPKNSKSLGNNFVLYTYEDHNDNIWVATFRGLDLLNKKTGEFFHYKPVPNDTSSWGINIISTILEDRQGKFWVGSFGRQGIYHLDIETGTFKDYLVGVSVRSIYEDADGVVWVGADDGLYQYNRSSDIFSRFIDPSSSRAVDNVFSIIEDNDRKLWLGTSIGIIQLNRERTQTTLYGKNYNINGRTLTTGVYKNRGGKLFFGSSTGYYAFNPRELKSGSKSPQIIFSAFRIADKLMAADANSPLQEHVSQATQIRLDYNQNVFSLDFLAFDYTNPGENRYLFMLENYDNTWHQGGLDRRASYYKVPPGKYTFRVKASNSDGVWGEKSITIIITPPWWRTWWAYCLYGLLILAMAYAFHRFQRQRVINAERERTRVREQAQAKEIEKAYHELKTTQQQLVQSEKMASLGELTAGIAHEIQNPLNFVNNFSEVSKELLDEMIAELGNGHREDAIVIADNVKQNLEKILHHGQRADGIVKGMLQHSRSSTAVKEPTDINKLADEYLRLAYHGLRAKDKSFNATLTTDFDESIGNINVIPQDIGRVLLNLITNAFYAVGEKRKQAGDGYEPTVSISTKKIGEKVEIRVKDNGNGIAQKILDKIFQPFFTTKPAGQGTGLGLSLAYDIVKAHGGEITVETKDGEGTEFIIFLT